MFFIACTFKGQVHVFAGTSENCKSLVLQDKCNMNYFCPLFLWFWFHARKNCTVQSLYNALFGVHRNLGAIACNDHLSKLRVAMVKGKVGEFHFQSGKFRKSEKKSWESQGISKIFKKLLVIRLLEILFSMNCKQYRKRN